MQQGQGRAEQIMSIQAAVAHTEHQQHLNAGQRAAAEAILTSRDVVQGLEGRAGVGKTTLLKSVRGAAEKRGYVVEASPRHLAPRTSSVTPASPPTPYRFPCQHQQPNSDRHLTWSMIQSRQHQQVHDFLANVDPSDHVLLIGDTRQHQGVGAGKPFEQLVNAGMKTTSLTRPCAKETHRIAERQLNILHAEKSPRVSPSWSSRVASRNCRSATARRGDCAELRRQSAQAPSVVSPDNASRRQINQAVRS